MTPTMLPARKGSFSTRTLKGFENAFERTVLNVQVAMYKSGNDTTSPAISSPVYFLLLEGTEMNRPGSNRDVHENIPSFNNSRAETYRLFYIRK